MARPNLRWLIRNWWDHSRCQTGSPNLLQARRNTPGSIEIRIAGADTRRLLRFHRIHNLRKAARPDRAIAASLCKLIDAVPLTIYSAESALREAKLAFHRELCGPQRPVYTASHVSSSPAFHSFPSPATTRSQAPLVPKLRLGTPFWKLRFLPFRLELCRCTAEYPRPSCLPSSSSPVSLGLSKPSGLCS